MALNLVQKATCQAIISIFETGQISGSDMYATISNAVGDTGGLSYGKHQVTLNSGNLYFLIQAYCRDNSDQPDAAQFAPYMSRLLNKDASLGDDADFLALLRDAATTPQMQQSQDAYFDRAFWNPADAVCSGIPWVHPISWAVVYDGYVQGAWALCRDLTNSAVGSITQVDEVTWIKTYVQTRRNWLATNSNSLLHETVYRMDAIQTIINTDRWDLQLPITVRDVKITSSALGFSDGTDDSTPVTVAPTTIASATQVSFASQLPLYLRDPPINSDLVVKVQTALTTQGYSVPSTGLYDSLTQTAVELFQIGNGLVSDGVVGPITFGKLGLT